MATKSPLVGPSGLALIDAIAGYVKTGLKARDAVMLAGFTDSAWTKWKLQADQALAQVEAEEEAADAGVPLDPDEDEEPLTDYRRRCVALVRAVKKAEAVLKQQMLTCIRSQCPKQWAAAMTLLERRFPDEFSVRHQIQGMGDVPLAGIDISWTRGVDKHGQAAGGDNGKDSIPIGANVIEKPDQGGNGRTAGFTPGNGKPGDNGSNGE